MHTASDTMRPNFAVPMNFASLVTMIAPDMSDMSMRQHGKVALLSKVVTRETVSGASGSLPRWPPGASPRLFIAGDHFCARFIPVWATVS